MKKTVLVRIVACGIVTLGALGRTVPQASAQSQRSYDVSDGFWVQPANPAILNLAVAQDFQHAWATRPGSASNATWSPSAQLPGFNPFGLDWQDPRGRVWNSGGTRVLENTTISVGPWPFMRANGVSATTSSVPNNMATASSGVLINDFVPGGAFSGSVRSTGTARVADTGAAYAFSSAAVSMWGLTADWRQGRIGWTPTFRDSVSGSALVVGRPPRPRGDPIVVTLFDDQGNVLLEETLVDVWTRIDEGDDAEVIWEDGSFSLTNALDGEFLLDLSSDLIEADDRGFARLRFEDGFITESTASGILDGLLPPIGAPSSFNVVLPNQFEFEYNAPDLGSNMEIRFANGLVPEPAAITLLAIGGLVLFQGRRR